MAEVYSIDTGTTGSVSAAKTIIELSAGSTASARVIEFMVGSSYTTSATPVSLLIEFITATTGTGTGYTPKKANGEAQNRAALCTAKINDSVEPSSVTVIRSIPPLILPGGPLIMQWPLGREGIYVPPSTMLGLRITPSAAVTCYANLLFEE